MFSLNLVFFDFPKRSSEGEKADFCFLVVIIRTQRNETKLHQGKFRLDIKKRFFTKRVVGHWNRLARELVMAPKLPEFKECLDDVLGHMVYC